MVVHILLAEDDEDVANCISRLLRFDGYEVHVAPSVPAFIREALTGGYDLIVADLLMPGGRGDEVVRWMRENGNQTPCIAVTGTPQDSAFPDDVPVLPKPVHIQILEEAIVEALKKHPPA